MGKTIILGGGESGYGAAMLAKKKGSDCLLSDRGTISEKYTTLLTENNIAFEQGAHSEAIYCEPSCVVKSPGIPDTAPVITRLAAMGAEIISEIEYASRETKAKIIAITGSNGKTTTATLTHKILSEGGVNVVLAGNIGDSFALSVVEDKAEWYVLEVSSFQLDGCFTFRPDIAVITNITPDHLDRYSYNMDLYVKSKFRIAQSQQKGDLLITTDKDPHTVNYLLTDTLKVTNILINNPTCSEGAFLSESGEFIVCRYAGEELQIETKKLIIKGLHNYANIMDSALCAMKVGVNKSSILASVYSFSGVEHRMEFVSKVGEVTYINDSKATNVDSTYYALGSLTTPCVWIAGGTDKGNDYSPLMEFAKKNVHTLVCMGKDNEKLVSSFTGVLPQVISTASLDEAFTAACDAAVSGDMVLLSPCCASFDLFKNYEDRGKQFKEKVMQLIR